MKNGGLLAAIESEVDRQFEGNPILKLPLIELFYLIANTGSLRLVENSGELPFLFSPFTFVFEKMEDVDFYPVSDLVKNWQKIDLHDFNSLMQCANLNIVFPHLHRGIYTFEVESEDHVSICYKSDKIKRFEHLDIILSNLSLPTIRNSTKHQKEFVRSIIPRLKRKEMVQPLMCKSYIKKVYADSQIKFSEAGLVSDDFFCDLGFFSKCDFQSIRDAFCAIFEVYNDAIRYTYRFLEGNDLFGTEFEDKLYAPLPLAAVPEDYLKRLILEVSKCSEESYEIFSKLFFTPAGELGGCSRTHFPPLVNFNGNVVFFSGISIGLMSTRNLISRLIEGQHKLNDVSFDSVLSKHLEPALIERACIQFLENGYQVLPNKKTFDSEVDLLVYCERSDTCLVIQAKAPIYPDSARNLSSIDGRVREACEQVLRFRSLSESKKLAVVKSAFPQVKVAGAPDFIYGILVNGSFGSYKSWEKMESEGVIPINCNILRNTLVHGSDLSQLGGRVLEYFERLLKLEVETPKTINFQIGKYTITQYTSDFDQRHLFESEYRGE
ncbi:hypothetical protein [Microbulbifer sp.]|uniref:hypothetical protein n=1 Tax=Microbulbifer sp. TaxID=1908541 RepID=UPI00258F14E8|nr:hypothetical protein [Microbulbifer sp.]